MVNVNNNPSSIQYQGMMRIKTDYWKDKVPTPKTKSYKE